MAIIDTDAPANTLEDEEFGGEVGLIDPGVVFCVLGPGAAVGESVGQGAAGTLFVGDGVVGVDGVVVGGAGEEPGVPAEDDETVMASFWPI